MQKVDDVFDVWIFLTVFLILTIFLCWVECWEDGSPFSESVPKPATLYLANSATGYSASGIIRLWAEHWLIIFIFRNYFAVLQNGGYGLFTWFEKISSKMAEIAVLRQLFDCRAVVQARGSP
ncbi:hypothetical protein OGAPHI_000145 [Ogataea philodendri]|uniref:Uncharacterized protein n=1 Tax=Ogataea philodendri TaxID=1378263 RepID=A0A9P8TAU1_9ASCO|nr:uncharacterized protein OGAPHI_000145 [Ogataea philodendri]KAH3671959.1 hypothetical protein OGAPHI_000145 [Ogataea philodendri]